MTGTYRRPFTEVYRNVLLVTTDDGIQTSLNTSFAALLPAAQFSSVNLHNALMPELDGIDLILLGIGQDRPATLQWLSTYSSNRIPPIICIDFAASIKTAVEVMRLGVIDYLDSKELDSERVAEALVLTTSTAVVKSTELLDLPDEREAASAEPVPASDMPVATATAQQEKSTVPFSGAWLRMPETMGNDSWPFTADDITNGTATLGNYMVLEFLGMGGMASVFKAQRQTDDKLFAIKLLDRSTSGENGSLRFKREFKILSNIKHKHVVQMEEQLEEDNELFTVMEYLSGGDLKARIRRHLKREEAIRYAAQIAAALQVAHDQNVLHRDLKPANVLFRADGTLALVDFGVAKDFKGADTDLTKEGTMVGTPYYASPEQATGAPVDQRSDLYALGVMLYEMLEGKRPFVGETTVRVLMAHVKDPIPALSQKWDVLNDIVSRLLAKKPADRFTDGLAVVRALQEASPESVPAYLLERSSN